MVRRALLTAALMLSAAPAAAQGPDTVAIQNQQREAMAAFARMDGVWRGPAWSLNPGGRHDIIQTERIGTFLNGTVRVVEGQHRAYVTDFIRDARAGGCAQGVPPANLGFRLVREETSWVASVSARWSKVWSARS